MAIFAVIIALLGQGLLPGVILCRGEEGHFAVEKTFDECCSPSVQAHMPSSLFFAASDLESAGHSSCGPCSDTLVSANPFKVPSHKDNSDMIPVQHSIIPVSGTASGAKKLFVSAVNPAELAMIPIKSTFLLL